MLGVLPNDNNDDQSTGSWPKCACACQHCDLYCLGHVGPAQAQAKDHRLRPETTANAGSQGPKKTITTVNLGRDSEHPATTLHAASHWVESLQHCCQLTKTKPVLWTQVHCNMKGKPIMELVLTCMQALPMHCTSAIWKQRAGSCMATASPDKQMIMQLCHQSKFTMQVCLEQCSRQIAQEHPPLSRSILLPVR